MRSYQRMGGNTRWSWTSIKLATWLLLAALIGPGRVCSLATEDDDYTVSLHEYKKVEFSAESATKESYTQFVEALRQQLASEYKRHEIPVMREPYSVADAERFLLVKLSNDPGGSVTFALDVTDANVVAYQAGRESYFFTDASNLAFSDLFTKTEKKWLSFGGKYPDLEKAARATRQIINLGIRSLDEAISTLYRSSRTLENTLENTLARSLIVVMQMVSGAARFRYIEQQVRFNIRSDKYQNFLPDLSIIELENNWIRLSTEVQESYQKAFTNNAVQLRRANSEIFYADSVSAILMANLALLKFICRSTEPTSVYSSSSLVRMASDYDDTCLTLEPTMKIVGRNGLCIVARNQLYSDGNPLILWDCGINHFWTFKRDGTIRRNGKCLTTYNFGPESYLMVYNCSTAPESTTLWVLNTKGSIINPVSGLSLSAASPKLDTILSVDKTINSASQGWLPSNYTQPFLASIVGFGDNCLKAKGNNLQLEGCVNGGVGREWAIYADGTIRTGGRCLTCNSPFKGSEVIIMDCSTNGWSSQRWMFNSDGTISNVNSGMVLEVKDADLSLGRIIIWTPSGSPNQKWLPLL